MLNNFKALFGVLIVLAGVAYYLIQSDGSQHDSGGKFLLPDWQSNPVLIDQITEVKLHKDGETIKLSKNDGSWHLNDGFFVNMDSLFQLLQSLKSAEIVELKTANPENHALLNLADDDLQVEILKDSQPLAVLHLGKKSAAGLTFVRRGGESQTYTVKGLNDVSFNQDNWQLKTVLDIQPNDIVAIDIQPVDGEAIKLKRDPETMSMQLTNMPEGYQLKAGAQINNLDASLSRLMVDDAQPLATDDLVLKLKNSYQLSDGANIELSIYQREENHYMVIESSHYPHYKNWMMKIAEYKFNALNKKLADYIEQIPDESQVDQEAATLE